MDKKKKGSSVFEKRGFYIALYACIALVLVSAAGLTYSSLGRSEGDFTQYPVDYSENRVNENEQFSREVLPSPEAETRDNNLRAELGDVSEVVPKGESGAAIKEETPENTDEITAERKSETARIANKEQGLEKAGDSETVSVYSNEEEPVSDLAEENISEENAQASENSASEVVSNETDDEYYSEDADAEVLADPVFNTFTGNEDMLWPVTGDVVMEFSADRLVYDSTLNQYRTNETICIAAEVGTQVKASADGVVRSVTNSRESGNAVTVEHGNGWFTTYSQLQDVTLVEEGDVVTEGQVIGGIGEPSIYSVLLGSHLSFKVEKDEVAVDPNIVLAAR